MAKIKVVKPKVWNGKKNKYVDATKGLCARCQQEGFIAMNGAGGKLCFDCFDERVKKWGER